MEHTDGLNYIHAELRRRDIIVERPGITISLREGFGAGAILPKTNAQLLGKARHDEFHWAGYGLSGLVGLNVTFFKAFFVQAEWKSGFIHLPDIRTTSSALDKASQHFFFTQGIVVVGGVLNFGKRGE